VQAQISHLNKHMADLDSQLANFPDAVSECAAQQTEQLVRCHEAQLEGQQSHIRMLEGRLRAAKIPLESQPAAAGPASSTASSRAPAATASYAAVVAHAEPVAESSDKQAWRQLIGMGFNSEDARAALLKASGDVDEAMNLLLTAAGN
jgi:hypothetical protein